MGRIHKVISLRLLRLGHQPTDRLLLSALSQLLQRPAWPSFLVSPETWLRWHQQLVRRQSALYARRPARGRPGKSAQRQDLILRLARENPRCGYDRIRPRTTGAMVALLNAKVITRPEARRDLRLR